MWHCSAVAATDVMCGVPRKGGEGEGRVCQSAALERPASISARRVPKVIALHLAIESARVRWRLHALGSRHADGRRLGEGWLRLT
jgi:hypothetical protein